MQCINFENFVNSNFFNVALLFFQKMKNNFKMDLKFCNSDVNKEQN